MARRTTAEMLARIECCIWWRWEWREVARLGKAVSRSRPAASAQRATVQM
jgi:hypothetical protein